ncbi:MAG TPA: DUF1326 domain-containing protein [Bryobacteraceae bacterium]|nr:DUF1326 domain-containing protein [Bryobacteraceae bacterium]
MKRLVLSLFLAGTTLMAAGLQNRTSVRGSYMEARTADVYTGACFANSEAGLMGEFAVFGWRVDEGLFEGVSLEGLSVVGVVRANTTLGDVHARAANPSKAVLIVDERATPTQRLALAAFARRMGGDLLQDIVRVEYQPVDIAFENNDIHSRKATLTAGNLAKLQTRAISTMDKVCSHEETWYDPLTKLDHAMPAFTMANDYKGKDLGTTWSSPDKRSAFVGSFQLRD